MQYERVPTTSFEAYYVISQGVIKIVKVEVVVKVFKFLRKSFMKVIVLVIVTTQDPIKDKLVVEATLKSLVAVLCVAKVGKFVTVRVGVKLQLGAKVNSQALLVTAGSPIEQ